MNDWEISEERKYALTRVVTLRPTKPIMTTFETSERRQGRYIDASYDASVIWATAHWVWSDSDYKWLVNVGIGMSVINSATGEAYKSGWRADPIRRHFYRGEVLPDYIADAVASTHPRTRISITETPE